MRIRWRPALYAATVTLLAVFGFSVLLLILGNASIGQEQEKTLIAAVEIAVEDFGQVDLDQLRVSVSPFLVDSPSSLEVFLIAADAEGRIEYTSGLVGSEEPRIPAAVILEALEDGTSTAVADVRDVEMRMSARRWPSSWSGDGVLVAMQPTEFAQQQLGGLVAVLWVAGIITLIATTIVGWLVSGRAGSPVGRAGRDHGCHR